MGEKHSVESFDFEEFKNQINQIKTASAQAKKEYEENKASGNYTKQPMGQKFIGIIILIALIAGIIFAVISNLDTIFLPKNSITITVTDQNGEAINGLKINIRSESEYYDVEFNEDIPTTTILNAIAGEYMLVFEEVPEGYSADESVDSFTLNQDGKIKLKYKCTKEN